MAANYCSNLTLEKVELKLQWKITVVNYSGIFITLAAGVVRHLKSLSKLACFPLEI
jgi:hypothetical protein